MTTGFILEVGYETFHPVEVTDIIDLISEIKPEDLLKRCKEYGIERFTPEINTFIEYCECWLEDYEIRDNHILFIASGGKQHRHTEEFVIKTLCLMVLEKAIKKEYNINLIIR